MLELVLRLLGLLYHIDLFLQLGRRDLPALAHDVDDVIPEWQSVVTVEHLTAFFVGFASEVEVESLAFFSADAKSIDNFTLDDGLSGSVIDVEQTHVPTVTSNYELVLTYGEGHSNMSFELELNFYSSKYRSLGQLSHEVPVLNDHVIHEVLVIIENCNI